MSASLHRMDTDVLMQWVYFCFEDKVITYKNKICPNFIAKMTLSCSIIGDVKFVIKALLYKNIYIILGTLNAAVNISDYTV